MLQLRVSLQSSQEPSSQIYPPRGMPRNPHGMLSPRRGHPAGKELTSVSVPVWQLPPGPEMRAGAASSRHAGYPAQLLPSHGHQYTHSVFSLLIHYLIGNRLIHYLVSSLSTCLSSGCQVPSGHPFSRSPSSPGSLAGEEINFFF